ncbi:MAG: hypothetical protein ACI3U2_03940 [Anaerovibrio sp.]
MQDKFYNIYAGIDYEPDYNNCIACKSDGVEFEDYLLLRKGTVCRKIKTSRITGHAVFFVEDAYLASAFAKNSHMEQFINGLYDRHEVFFAWYLAQTPYRYHRIFADMDEILRKRAMKALAIITAAKYSNHPTLSMFLLQNLPMFYKKLYVVYNKAKKAGKSMNIYRNLASEYDLASLSVLELGELYAVRDYIFSDMVFDEANESLFWYLAVEDMAMLQPQGVLYPYKEAYEARERHLKKWIWPKWDDTGIPAWEEAWTIDEYRMLVKTTESNRKRQIEYVARSKNKQAQS